MTRNKASDEALLDELVTIRRLLMFGILRTGVTQRQLANALGISQSTVSRMFPDAAAKRAKPDLEEAE